VDVGVIVMTGMVRLDRDQRADRQSFAWSQGIFTGPIPGTRPL